MADSHSALHSSASSTVSSRPPIARSPRQPWRSRSRESAALRAIAGAPGWTGSKRAKGKRKSQSSFWQTGSSSPAWPSCSLGGERLCLARTEHGSSAGSRSSRRWSVGGAASSAIETAGSACWGAVSAVAETPEEEAGAVLACPPRDLRLRGAETWLAVVAALTSERAAFFLCLPPELCGLSPCAPPPFEPRPERKPCQTWSKALCRCCTLSGRVSSSPWQPQRLCRPPRSVRTGCGPSAAACRSSLTETCGVTSLCSPTRKDQSVAGCLSSSSASSHANISPPLLAFTSRTEPTSPSPSPPANLRHASSAMSSSTCSAATTSPPFRPAARAAAATAASESARQEQPASLSALAGLSPSSQRNIVLKPALA
mmetsp:Transcript_76369/g.223980  ORF Transcript_76369/g.223980 Transcript_76369/m.223980 type:complete len:371 (-) Transcript_76369:56-1168(-)